MAMFPIKTATWLTIGPFNIQHRDTVTGYLQMVFTNVAT